MIGQNRLSQQKFLFKLDFWLYFHGKQVFVKVVIAVLTHSLTIVLQNALHMSIQLLVSVCPEHSHQEHFPSAVPAGQLKCPLLPHATLCRYKEQSLPSHPQRLLAGTLIYRSRRSGHGMDMYNTPWSTTVTEQVSYYFFFLEWWLFFPLLVT